MGNDVESPRDESGAGAAAGRDGPAREREEIAFLARLASGLAHEIKNPLSTMAINLALLEEDLAGPLGDGRRSERRAPESSPREERVLRRVKTLKREVQRLEHIVEEFRSFARGRRVNRKPEDLARLVRDLLEFVEPEDEAAGIRHHVDLEPGLPLVLVDAEQLQQAILNLLVNARQAMPDGGELIVRMRRRGNLVELAITDTGVGMRPGDLERCFDVYWSNKKGGTGLGLAVTKRVVEEHGGAISVVSEEGRGTSFAVLLPLAVEITGSQSDAAGRGRAAEGEEGEA